MRIGIDLDEVLGDLLNNVIEYHNNTYNTSLKKEDFFSYNFWEVWGGTKDEAINKVYDFHKTNYFKNIKPLEGAREAINILKKDHELFIITSRQKDVITDTNNWVNKYFPNSFSGVYFGNHFSKNGISKSKRDICDEIGIDLLIEDSLSYALDCVSPNRRVFLFDYAWNKSLEHENINRVNSWNDVLDKI